MAPIWCLRWSFEHKLMALLASSERHSGRHLRPRRSAYHVAVNDALQDRGQAVARVRSYVASFDSNLMRFRVINNVDSLVRFRGSHGINGVPRAGSAHNRATACTVDALDREFRTDGIIGALSSERHEGRHVD